MSPNINVAYYIVSKKRVLELLAELEFSRRGTVIEIGGFSVMFAGIVGGRPTFRVEQFTFSAADAAEFLTNHFLERGVVDEH